MLGFDFDSAVSLQRFEAEFQDLGKIGAGGFSVVNKVRNKRDHKEYALKVVKIKPSELKNYAFDHLQKVFSEAKIISGLSHPNILQYHGCWVNADLKKPEEQIYQEQQQEKQHHEEEQLELVMYEYEEGSCGIQFQKRSSSAGKKTQPTPNNNNNNNNNNKGVYYEHPNDNILGSNIYKYRQIRFYLLSQLGECSLQKYINLRNQKIRRGSKQKLQITIQNYKMILDIVEGLAYIHNQRLLIHRDIKLQNIIVDRRGRCKIIDFGLAKKVRNLKSLTIQKFQHEIEIVNSDDSERHSSSVGTRIFSSPEQSNSQNYDHRTDIYSLAMVIGIMFSEYSTAHEEGELLLNLRNKKLEGFKIHEQLKGLLIRCLSEQKQRPDLNQLKRCVKKLLREAIAALNILNQQEGLTNYDEILKNVSSNYEVFKEKSDQFKNNRKI